MARGELEGAARQLKGGWIDDFDYCVCVLVVVVPIQGKSLRSTRPSTLSLSLTKAQ